MFVYGYLKDPVMELFLFGSVYTQGWPCVKGD